MILLLVAGIAFVLIGLMAIAFGIPVKEFSFGNTMILSGVVATGTGAVLLGLYAAVRELVSVALRSGSGMPVRPPTKPRLPPLDLPKPDGEASGAVEVPLFPGDRSPQFQPAPVDTGGGATDAPSRQDDAARDRGRPRPPAEAPPIAPPPEEPAVKPRRNLLFSSSTRKERERAASLSDSPPAEPDVAPASPAAAEPAPKTFEEAWPEPERARNDVTARRSRPAGAEIGAPASSPAAPVGPQPGAPPPVDAPPQVTVLKSGVVDGMAYSLYSDGSIEAQMPEGMMRFASIDELRSHLDQRP